MQELCSDAIIKPDGSRDVLHVAADHLAEVGDLVDEGDLHRKKRVRSVLVISAFSSDAFVLVFLFNGFGRLHGLPSKTITFLSSWHTWLSPHSTSSCITNQEDQKLQRLLR